LPSSRLRQAGERGWRFQSMGWTQPRHTCAGQWLLGDSCPKPAPATNTKYEIVGPDGHLLPLKSDPLAFAAELRLQSKVDRDTIQQPQPAPAGIKLVLLKEIAPRVSRVTAIFNPAMAPRGGAYYLASIEAAAQSFGVEAIDSPIHVKSGVRSLLRMSVEASCGFDRGDSCRSPIVLVSAWPRSNIRAVWHLDEFVVPNVRAVPRVHLFPADFTVRQTVILGHGFSCLISYTAPQWGHLKVSAISKIYAG
jgi:hypothetical protein